MTDRRPAPGELRKLVEDALPPRASLELDWWDFDFMEWRFRLSWSGRRFVLRVPGQHYEDGLIDLIALCASYAAPRPAVTIGGYRFSLLLERMITGDARRFSFSVVRRVRDDPQASTVVVTGSAFGMLAARRGKHEEQALESAMAIWTAKDMVDHGRIGEDIELNASNCLSFLERPAMSDTVLRNYAGLKTYETYRAAGKISPVGFGWLDFGYLGVTEDDFMRAVSLRDGKDWVLKGKTLMPTSEFLERLDAEEPKGAKPPAAVRASAEMRDLFVSHASEDKDAFVRPLVEALTSTGVTVWFDEHELVLGDSLRERIDDGLRNSRHGLVVLSESFFAKAWPKKELDGLFALMDRDRRIMPIWHGLTADQVRVYSPILAGIVGVKSSEGLEAVTAAVVRSIRRPSSQMT